LDLNETTILHVCQRIKEEVIDDSADNIDPNDVFGDVMMDTNNNKKDSYEIWALIEYKTANDNDTPNNPLNTPSFRRHRQWQCFPNESALSDYICHNPNNPHVNRGTGHRG